LNAPTVQIDLTDEIGSPLVGWVMLSDGKRVGSATSRIKALEGRVFEFHSTFHFDEVVVAQLKTIETMDRVGEDGKMQAMAMKVVLHPNVYELEGTVVDEKMALRVFFNTHEVNIKSLGLDEIDMSGQGKAVSSLKLVSRLRGLHEGQTWSEDTFDPSRGLKDKIAVEVFKSVRIPSLLAQVKLDTLTWDKKEVACHLIEYHDSNKNQVARVWVRKRDGLVLQREVSVLGRELTLQRVPH
jgi:hypothetical protein